MLALARAGQLFLLGLVATLVTSRSSDVQPEIQNADDLNKGTSQLKHDEGRTLLADDAVITGTSNSGHVQRAGSLQDSLESTCDQGQSSPLVIYIGIAFGCTCGSVAVCVVVFFLWYTQHMKKYHLPGQWEHMQTVRDFSEGTDGTVVN
ncbi:hypothetical protein Bbelb_026490 [Branchiostoma belcheri]|nr:hypothetical protein Bbelb_026490 [Branchiostoma belcheri]